MAVLLEILIETLILIGLLWIGKSVMKAQVDFKTILVTSLAGALASQVPFVGLYLSFLVILFFMWKMARVDIVPDGALIVIMGKGVGFILMILVVAILKEHLEPQEFAVLEQIPIYQDDKGTRYFAEEEKVYYFDDNEEKVYVDANEIFGISEIMKMADGSSSASETETIETSQPETEALAESDIQAPQSPINADPPNDFSEPLLSDSIIRGEPVPFQLYVPQGWSFQKQEGALAVRFDGQTFVHCFSRDTLSDNKAYLREELNRVLSQYAGYRVARQEVVTIDKKQWARIQLANDQGDQVLLLTHGSYLGGFTVELNGSFQQLSAHQAVLRRIISSFKFPPTTFFLAQLHTEEDY